MAKFELVKKTENNGDVWYFIKKDGIYVDNSSTRDFEMGCEMLESFKKGKQSEPIIEIIKSIEVDEELLKKIYEKD
jgi:hypothetical protein